MKLLLSALSLLVAAICPLAGAALAIYAVDTNKLGGPNFQPGRNPSGGGGYRPFAARPPPMQKPKQEELVIQKKGFELRVPFSSPRPEVVKPPETPLGPFPKNPFRSFSW